MNRKISVGMTVTIVILAMTVTFSITMLLAMRLFDRTVTSVKEKESMYNKDVIAFLQVGLLCGGLVVHLGDLGVAGLVDGQLHADADQLAALGIEQVGVGRGGVK